MKRIGLLSDTHGFINDRVFTFFEKVDEIWHAGDIGNLEAADKLAAFKPLKAVYGNIDGHELRAAYPLHQRFKCEEVDVWITHIGGYPKAYNVRVREEIKMNPPKLFISGHSHILKVMPDNKLNLLHMNPGAVGKHGFHKTRTMLRFTIDGSKIANLEVVEFPVRHPKS